MESSIYPASDIRDPYGAAGALIVLMFWVYYSAQIFLLGAELTKAIDDARNPAAREEH